MGAGCIFIVGYMGAGKSSGGRRLANALKLPFSDTDSVLSAEWGRSISELFAEWGEARFRKEESKVLRGLAEGDGQKVVATGGGTPCHEGNMDFMLERGIVVHFQVALDALFLRLSAKRKERPLLADIPEWELEAFIRQHLAEREPVYRRAHITVDAEGLDAGRLASTGRMIRTMLDLNP